jgi:hypothetical protein
MIIVTLLALHVVFMARYDYRVINRSSGPLLVVRIDRWSGAVEFRNPQAHAWWRY